MPRPRPVLNAALLLTFGAWLAVTAAPGWLPSLALLHQEAASLARPASAGAGLAYALHHHVEMLFKVGVLHLVLAGSGAAAARWLAGRARPGWLVAWALGFGLIGLQTLGFGLAGLLFPGPVLLAALPWAVAAVLRLRAERPWRAWRGSVGSDPTARLAAGAAAAAALILVALALPPDSSWDAVVYHLRVPAFFVQEHRVFHMPTHHFTTFPLGVEMLNAWLMCWGGLDRMGGGQAPKLLHVSAALVAALAARRLALRAASGDPAAGWGAAALVLLCPVTGTIAPRAYNDFVQAAFAGLAGVLLVERPRGGMALAAALAGAALGAKFTAVMTVAALGVLWWRARPRPYAIAAAAVLPWLAKGWLLTGDPVAPFAAGLFRLAPETGFQLRAYADSVAGMTLAPRMVAAAAWGMFQDATGETLTELLPLLLAVGVLYGSGRRRVAPRQPRDAVLGWYAVILVGVWAALTPAVRFFAPVLPAVAALAGAAVPVARAGLGSATPALAGVLLALNVIRLPLTHLALFDPLPFLVGRTTVEDQAARLMFPAPYYGEVAGWANRNLPPQARVLVLVDIKAHYVWRRTLHDFQYVKPGLLLRWIRQTGSARGLAHKCREEGVTHLLVIRQMTRDVGWHLAWDGRELAIAAEFFARWTRGLVDTSAAEVAEILPAPAPRPRALGAFDWMLFMYPENLILKDRQAEAVTVLADAIRAAPWLKGARAELGWALAKEGRYPAAAAALRAGAAEGGEKAPMAAYLLGQVGELRKDTAGAIAGYRRAVALQPVYPEAHLRLALLLWAAGRRPEAAGEAALAAKQDPGNADAHERLALMLWQTGRRAEGAAEAALAARLAPENAEYANTAGGMARESGGAAAP